MLPNRAVSRLRIGSSIHRSDSFSIALGRTIKERTRPMVGPLNPQRDFSSLAVLNLLEARNAYHVHLAHMEHVVATAIGRFWIRNSDPDAREPTETVSSVDKSRQASPARTLQNSTVTRWSWPCVLVF